jgi:hypothetical protein
VFRKITAVALTATLAGWVGSTAPAAAGPTTAGERDLGEVQMTLIASADRIAAVARPARGWTGISVEPEAGELRLYWNGELPAAVGKAVDAERRRVPVMVVKAPYSERALLAAGDGLLRERTVTGVAPAPTGTGLVVSVSGDEESARALPAVRAATVPLTFSTFEHPVLAADRQHDTSPYRGGAFYHWPVDATHVGLCTTGFPLLIGAGDVRMLSAGHCGEDGKTVRAGNGSGATPVMGTMSGTDRTHDTLLIDTPSAASVYFGPYASFTSKPTRPAIGNYVDTLVCTTGAMTGQHCAIRVTLVDKTIKVADEDGAEYLITELVQAEHDTKQAAIGQGDSGGPVVAQDSWAYPGDGSFVFVYPEGTITAEDLGPGMSVPCASQYPTACSWRMYYADITKSLTRYGATIRT